MNLEQFETFIKKLPNMHMQYEYMWKSLVKNTGLGEHEAKLLIAKELLKAINSAMPRKKE